MIPLLPRPQSVAVVVVLAWLQLSAPVIGQEKKEAPQPLPDGLKTILARRDDKDRWTSSCALSPDGKLVTVSHQSGIGIWNVRTGKKQSSSFPVMRAQAMLFTSDGKMLLTVDEHQGLVVWEVETGKRLRTCSPGKTGKGDYFSMHCPAFSPSEDVFACSVNGSIRFWRLADGKELTGRRIAPPKDFLFTTLACSADGTLLFAGTHCRNVLKRGQPTPGADVRVWAGNSLRPVMTLERRWGKFEDGTITHCQASADGRLLACCVRRELPREESDPVLCRIPHNCGNGEFAVMRS